MDCHHREDPQWKRLYERAYGKRPQYELYDLKKDPHQMNNVADDPAYASLRNELETRLIEELRSTGDPRMQQDGEFYETPPMTGPIETQPQGLRNKVKQP